MFHIESMSSTSCNSRLSTYVFARRLSRLLRAGLTIFVKRCCTISRISFTSSAPTPRSFMIFSKSARESHTLPPAKLLRQNSTGLASISACVRLLISYHRTPCRLTSHCLSQLGSLREFLSVQSTNIHESKENIRAHRASSKATKPFLTK